MASAGGFDIQSLTAKVKTLINAHLKVILKNEGLPMSGVKSAMQERVISQLTNYARLGNQDGFNQIRALVYDPESKPFTSPSRPIPSAQPQQLMPNNMNPRMQTTYSSIAQSTAFGTSRLNFKESPFYTIVDNLTPALELKAIDPRNAVREATRDSIDCKISLTSEQVKRFEADDHLGIMVYSATETITPYAKSDIAFPHQIEIKINGDEVKANLRGLKNKAGSTRPADITKLLRVKAGYENTMLVTWALTIKKHYIIVNLVKQYPVQDLVKRLKGGKFISKEQVVREMISKAEDSDIVATSSIMSLKCPLSTLRIDIPCRSTSCTHNQCFDALSFLQLQEQAPTWTCPVCNRVVSFENLEVDQYVNDILRSTPKSVEQVTVEPNGSWQQLLPADGLLHRNGPGGAQSSEDDDDLIEIQDKPRLAAIKDEVSSTFVSMTRTPPYSSRESSSSKRPIGQVIDLTLVDSDDDQAPKGTKRHHTGYTDMTNPAHPYVTPASNPEPSMPRSSSMSFGLPKPSPARPPGLPNYRFGLS